MTTEPQVVNRHWYKRTGIPAAARYIGRGTPLGNPYRVGDHGTAALNLYRKWLWSKIRARDRDVLEALQSITPETLLMCSCAPRPCHGDVVVRAWSWMRDQGMLDA